MKVLWHYKELRHNAVELPKPAERLFPPTRMNPEIYRRFFDLVASDGGSIVWEPFSLPTGSGFQHAKAADITLISHSLESRHEKVFAADSTVQGPCCTPVDGMLFHPPYFGSATQSEDPRDLSYLTSADYWLSAMESAAEIGMENLTDGGLVCAVGSRYRHDGEEVRLDEWLRLAFCGMALLEVWRSEPDVAMILRTSA